MENGQTLPSNYESTSQDNTIQTSGRIQHPCSFPRDTRVKMPFKVEQLDNNMSQVEWTVTMIKPPAKKVDNETSIEETLQLFLYNSFVLCKVTCYLSIKHSKLGECTASLRMRWHGNPTSNGLEGSSGGYRHLPCNISVSVDGSQRNPLKPVWVLEKNSWKSDALVISSNENGELNSSRKFPVNLIFQVKYEPSFCRGEKKALKLLTDLYVHQVDCDVQFEFEGDRRIGGHSKILSARSQIFAALFQKNKETNGGPIVIEDIAPEIFLSLLNYIYCGRISTPLTDLTAEELYVAASKFEIEDLKEDCIDYLSSCLTHNNVNNLITWSRQHSAEKLRDAAHAFRGKELVALKKVDCNAVPQKVIKKAPIAKKSSVAPKSHPPYLVMVVEAIKILKQKSKGSSRQAILNYIFSSFKLGVDLKMANVHLKQALKKGVAQGVLFNTKVSIVVFCYVMNEKFSLLVC